MVGAATIIIIAAHFFSIEPCLVVRYTDTNRVIARFATSENTEFSIEFVHSVNQTPVRDVFTVSGKDIVPTATYFFAFGAGMQTALEAGQKLHHHPDGSLSITGFTQRFPQLNYIVGTVSDHILTVNGMRISLRELCGSNAAVTFTVEERIRFAY